MSLQIPQFFTCPISLELFTDPVTLCTGQTYDRPCIEKWLAAGNVTCPVTMQKLHDLSIVPNHTLKHLIDQWLQKSHNNQHQVDDLDDVYQVGCSNTSLSLLRDTLESQEFTSSEQKIHALEQVLCLSDDDDLSNRNESLIQMGFFPLILGLLFGAQNTQETMGLVEIALLCVLKLMPFCHLGHLNMLKEQSKFERFKALFKEGTCMVKARLCNFIEVISTSPSLEAKELTSKIGNESTILQGLISSLHDYEQNYELSEAGVKAILGLLSSSPESYRENLVKEGLVSALVTFIVKVEGEEKNLAPKSTRALELLLECQSGKEAFLETEVPSGVKALIKMVFRVSGDDEGSESAVNSLMILCTESLEVREEAICGGILTQLLLLLQSQCSGSAKNRARLLLKLLRSMWTMDPKYV